MSVAPWTVFRREFKPSMVADEPFLKFLVRYLLNLKKGSPTRLVHGSWEMIDGRLMQKTGMYGRGDKKPPFTKVDLNVGYYVVDAPVNDVFTTPPQLPFNIASTAVFVNKSRSVTIAHVDQDDAIFFMVKGSKTFRCTTNLATTTPRPELLTSPQPVSAPLFDIVLKEGDVLFVPHNRVHSVHSDPNSIGISVTVIEKKSAKVPSKRRRRPELETNASLKDTQREIDAVVQHLSTVIRSPVQSFPSDNDNHPQVPQVPTASNVATPVTSPLAIPSTTNSTAYDNSTDKYFSQSLMKTTGVQSLSTKPPVHHFMERQAMTTVFLIIVLGLHIT